ncbi:MAG: hypothetical protein BWX91_01553 [Spirochaetes bacterium ADurb.Bin133]|nr:MAG: hypothetical protein BWX91_02375 [Spirochaetes bacterium ADurb.Bin133]OQB67721.1 MAG: hypothetical protein BWX91_01553 [Spirochaetes bacterium ADurb.Bin133]
MIKELFQSVKSHFLKYASSLKVERHRFILILRILSVFWGRRKFGAYVSKKELTHMHIH